MFTTNDLAFVAVPRASKFNCNALESGSIYPKRNKTSQEQLWAMINCTVEGHTSALRIPENLDARGAGESGLLQFLVGIASKVVDASSCHLILTGPCYTIDIVLFVWSYLPDSFLKSFRYYFFEVVESKLFLLFYKKILSCLFPIKCLC